MLKRAQKSDLNTEAVKAWVDTVKLDYLKNKRFVVEIKEEPSDRTWELLKALRTLCQEGRSCDAYLLYKKQDEETPQKAEGEGKQKPGRKVRWTPGREAKTKLNTSEFGNLSPEGKNRVRGWAKEVIQRLNQILEVSEREKEFYLAPIVDNTRPVFRTTQGFSLSTQIRIQSLPPSHLSLEWLRSTFRRIERWDLLAIMEDAISQGFQKLYLRTSDRGLGLTTFVQELIERLRREEPSHPSIKLDIDPAAPLSLDPHWVLAEMLRLCPHIGTSGRRRKVVPIVHTVLGGAQQLRSSLEKARDRLAEKRKLFVILEGIHHLPSCTDSRNLLAHLSALELPEDVILFFVGCGTEQSDCALAPQDTHWIRVEATDCRHQETVREWVKTCCTKLRREDLHDLVSQYSRHNFLLARFLLNSVVQQINPQSLSHEPPPGTAEEIECQFQTEIPLFLRRASTPSLFPNHLPKPPPDKVIHRTALLENLRRTITETETNVFVLTAPPGYGKSEISRQLGWHMWRSTSNPIYFYEWSRSISEELCALVRNLPPNPDRDSWIIIDHLERCDPNLDLIAELHRFVKEPDGKKAKVLMPTWEDSLPLSRFGGEEYTLIDLPRFDQWLEEDLRAFLRKVLNNDLQREIDRVIDFVNGSFLIADFVRRVATDWREWPFDPDTRFSGNLQATFEQLLRQREEQTGELRDSLYLLAQAPAPVPAQVFHSWLVRLKKKRPGVKLHPVEAYLDGRESHEEIGNEYAFFHSMVRDFFRSQAFECDLTSDLNRLIEGTSVKAEAFHDKRYYDFHLPYHQYWGENYPALVNNVCQDWLVRDQGNDSEAAGFRLRNLQYGLEGSIRVMNPTAYYRILCSTRDSLFAIPQWIPLQLEMKTSVLAAYSQLPTQKEHATLLLAAAYIADHQDNPPLTRRLLELCRESGGISGTEATNSGIPCMAEILSSLSIHHPYQVASLVETKEVPCEQSDLLKSRLLRVPAIPLAIRSQWLRELAPQILQGHIYQIEDLYLIHNLCLALVSQDQAGFLVEIQDPLWKALVDRRDGFLEEFIIGLFLEKPSGALKQWLKRSLKGRVENLDWIESHRAAELIIRFLAEESTDTLKVLLDRCVEHPSRGSTVFLDACLALSQCKNAPVALNRLKKTVARHLDFVRPTLLLPGYLRYLLNKSDEKATEYIHGLRMINDQGVLLWKFIWACFSNIEYPEGANTLFPEVTNDPDQEFNLPFPERVSHARFQRLLEVFLHLPLPYIPERVHALCHLLAIATEPKNTSNLVGDLIAVLNHEGESGVSIVAAYVRRGFLDNAISHQGASLADISHKDTESCLSLWMALCAAYTRLGMETDAQKLASEFLDHMEASGDVPLCMSLLATNPYVALFMEGVEDRVFQFLGAFLSRREKDPSVVASVVGSAIVLIAVKSPTLLGKVFAQFSEYLPPCDVTLLVESALLSLSAWTSDYQDCTLEQLIAFLSVTTTSSQPIHLTPSAKSALQQILLEVPSVQRFQDLLTRLSDLLDDESRSDLAGSLSSRLFRAGWVSEALFPLSLSQQIQSVAFVQREACLLTASRLVGGDASGQAPELIHLLLKNWRESYSTSRRSQVASRGVFRRIPRGRRGGMHRNEVTRLVKVAVQDLFREVPPQKRNEGLQSCLLDLFDADWQSRSDYSLCDRVFRLGRINEALWVLGRSEEPQAVPVLDQDVRLLACSRLTRGSPSSDLIDPLSSLPRNKLEPNRSGEQILHAYARLVRSTPHFIDGETHRTALMDLAGCTHGDGDEAGHMVVTLLESFGSNPLPAEFVESLGFLRDSLPAPEVMKCTMVIDAYLRHRNEEDRRRVLKLFLSLTDMKISDFRHSLLVLKIRECRNESIVTAVLAKLRHALQQSQTFQQEFSASRDMLHNLAILVFLNRDQQAVQEAFRSIKELTQDECSSQILRTLYTTILDASIGDYSPKLSLQRLHESGYPEETSSADLMEVWPHLLSLHELAVRKSSVAQQQEIEEALTLGLSEAMRRRNGDLPLGKPIYGWGLEMFEERLLQHMVETGYVVGDLLALIQKTMVEEIRMRIGDQLPLHHPKKGSLSPKQVNDLSASLANRLAETITFRTVMSDLDHQMIQHLCPKDLERLEGMVHSDEPLPAREAFLENLFSSSLGAGRLGKAKEYHNLAVTMEQKDRFSSELSRWLSSSDLVTSMGFLTEIGNPSLRMMTASKILPKALPSLDKKMLHELSEVIPYSPDLQCELLGIVLEESSDKAALDFATHLVAVDGKECLTPDTRGRNKATPKKDRTCLDQNAFRSSNC